jgi:cellulose synthase/poly-beta-1,6-N-acetylglucosamine synthase-like glycosyltransferase
MIALEIVCWSSLAMIVYTHIGYPLLLRVLVALRPEQGGDSPTGSLPSVSLVVAAHDEEGVIAEKIENALALDYPAEQLEVIVASDGSADGTVAAARDAFARQAHVGVRAHVLELERLGKVRAQDAAVDVASGELLAFSDANAMWEGDALRALVAAFADESVGYVCGRLRYLPAAGANEEGAYWRYETAVRSLETRLGSITAGNGAIYAVRRAAYLRLDPRTSHDLSFPFNLVKRGWRALYEPRAAASERPVATIEGEFRRKRRMMSHAWPAVIAGGMLDPRGYGPTYALEIYSHRVLRYATPLLHLTLLGSSIALAPGSALYGGMLAAQLAFVVAAALSRVTGARSRVLALPYYYLLVTASLAAGLWDWLRRGTPSTWERAEGRG